MLINNNHKYDVIKNIDKVHTTHLGEERIKNNLNIMNIDIVKYIKNKINDKKSVIYKKGKNYYCEVEKIIITINSYNYCIITAHKCK